MNVDNMRHQFAEWETDYITRDAARYVRAYAAEFPTPNVLRAVELCESGRLSWVDVSDMLARATATALTEVKGES